MNAECTTFQERRVDGRPLRESDQRHVHGCDDCRSFMSVERTLAPPDALVNRAFDRLAPLLRERRARRRQLAVRLGLAGALSLPVLVTINTALVWLSYAAASRILSPEVGTFVAVSVGGSLLLGIALSYGSLPLLASWGSQLRERTA